MMSLLGTALFGLIYKLLPSVHLAWRDVLIGALVTALLFSVGKYLIGVYLGNGEFAQAKEATRYALSRLKPGDRFNVIEFNSRTRALFSAPMPVDHATIRRWLPS